MQYTNYDGPSFTCKFDKQPPGNTSLAHTVGVVLRNYDCNRPILTIIRTVHSFDYLEPVSRVMWFCHNETKSSQYRQA